MSPSLSQGAAFEESTLSLCSYRWLDSTNAVIESVWGAAITTRAFGKQRFQRSKLIGLAFEAQLADFEPALHDVPMQAVITEDRVIERTSVERTSVERTSDRSDGS